MNEDLSRFSKYLSLTLRHKPDAIGLLIDPEGWALIDELIEKAEIPLSREIVQEVVSTSDKKRFSITADGLFIRANQGHSIKVDLGLEPKEPPELLYHGTATRFLESIRQQGLHPKNRHYVHLSSDEETARAVGQRHGKPVILVVHAQELYRKGHRFFLSENGVWLTDEVPSEALVYPNP